MAKVLSPKNRKEKTCAERKDRKRKRSKMGKNDEQADTVTRKKLRHRAKLEKAKKWGRKI